MGKLVQRLGDPSQSGVYRASAPAALVSAGAEGGLDVVRIDAADDVLARIAERLDFPAWFGRNWDALEDCLGDLSWRAGHAGHLIVFDAYPSGGDLGVLLDVLRSTAEYWSERARPFFVVFIDPARELSLPDLYRGA
jgi:hypothetical protein